MSLDLPGFRRLPGGVIALSEPILGYQPDIDRLEDAAPTRIGDADAVLHKIARGWRPGVQELDDAPIVHGWTVRDVAGWLIIVGIVSGHPRWSVPRLVGTSPLIALDERTGWARTVSRWYWLGRPEGVELSS